MDPQRGKNPVMLLGDLDGAVERPWPRAAADRQNPLEPGFACALQDFRAIVIELVAFEMGVGVNVHDVVLCRGSGFVTTTRGVLRRSAVETRHSRVSLSPCLCWWGL